MSGTDMVPALITGGAVLVGALAGGTISGLSTWVSSRQSRKDARDDRRRTAYAAFIGAQEELRRVVLAWQTADLPPAPDGTFGRTIAKAVGSVDRAFVAVTLAGPQKAQDDADDVRAEPCALYAGISGPERSGQPVLPKVDERIADYVGTCEQFSRTAPEVLRTRLREVRFANALSRAVPSGTARRSSSGAGSPGGWRGGWQPAPGQVHLRAGTRRPRPRSPVVHHPRRPRGARPRSAARPGAPLVRAQT